MTKHELKTQTDRIIENLPDNVSWEDFMYRIYVRKKIEQGLSDAHSGRHRTTEEVRKELGLE